MNLSVSPIIRYALVVPLLVLSILGCTRREHLPARELLSEARNHLRLGQLDECSKKVELLRAQGDDGPAVMILAGEIATKRGDYALAIEEYQNIAEDDPEFGIAALTARAEIHRTLGQFSVAEPLYESIIGRQPNSIFATQRLINMAMITGRYHRARLYASDMIRQGQVNLEILGLLATNDLNFVNREFLQSALKKSPDDPIIQLGLARWHLQRNQPNEAKKLLNHESMKSSQADFPEWNLTLMELALNDSQKSAFLNLARKHETELKAFPEYWHMLGQFCETAMQPKSALRCYWEAVKLSPDRRKTLFALGRLLNSEGFPKKGASYTARAELVEQIRQLMTSVELNRNSVPNDEFLYQTTRLMSKLNRNWEAVAWSHVATQNYPDLDWPKETLETLTPTLSATTTLMSDVSHPAIRYPMDQFNMPDLATLTTSPNRSVSTFSRSEDYLLPRFSERAEEIGIDFVYFESPDKTTPGRRIFEGIGGGVGVIDFDVDGWPDLYFPQGTELPSKPTSPVYHDHLYRNIDGESAHEVSQLANVNELNYSQGITVGDYNQDGFDDILVTNIGQNTLLLNNGDGTFSAQMEAFTQNDESWTVSCAMTDINQDHLPDLIEVNYLAGPGVYDRICESDGHAVTCNPHAFEGAKDRVLINQGDGTFLDKTDELGFDGSNGKGLGLVVGDFSHTQTKQVFVGNDSVANFFYVPDANGRYVDSGLLSGLSYDRTGLSQACMGIAAADFTQNQRLDLFVTNFIHESNTLYNNIDGSYFEDESASARLTNSSLPLLGFGTQAIDFENDGDPDIVVVNGDIDDFTFEQNRSFRMPPLLHVNLGDARFVTVPNSQMSLFFQSPQLGRGLARLDWNRDGRVDFAVSNLDQKRASLVINETETDQGFICLKLIGDDSGRDVVGTRIEATAAGYQHYAQVTAGDGFASSNERLIHIGVGNRDSIDDLTVTWPTGRQDVFKDLSAHQTYIVIEGRGILKAVVEAR